MATFIKRNGTLVPVKAFQKTGGGTVSDLTGTTWYFNEEVMADSLVHRVDFISNNTPYSTINRLYWFNNNGSGTRGGVITPGPGPEPEPEPIGGQNYIEYGNDTVATGIVDAVQYPCTWTNNAYRTITITGGTDATNATLIAWLQNNATLVSGGASLSPVELSYKEHMDGFLTFSSPDAFTLEVVDHLKYWDGTLEYSTDTENWSTWDGTTTLSAVANNGTYYLYLRGSNNTYITGTMIDYDYEEGYWKLTGSNISCKGNIETLLDYQTVLNGNHPTMASHCYYYMFVDCTSLTTAPNLPATTLALNCYNHMFSGCTSLTSTPELPATTLANGCYGSMFSNCKALTSVPNLPATTLTDYCYEYMFDGCTSLTTAPELPATTLATCCYYCMFSYCNSLITAPNLPATTLTDYCYEYMFDGCTSLTTAPELPATTLATYCYYYMFYGCTSLTTAPALPATTLANNCYYYMFSGCTSLTTAPALPATTLADSCYKYMFSGCTSLTTAPALPATTLANNCYYYMFYGCSKIKLSTSQTGEYTQAYRIPTSGTGSTGTNSLQYMFSSTGGTFTGTPTINTTYYLSNTNIIVNSN